MAIVVVVVVVTLVVCVFLCVACFVLSLLTPPARSLSWALPSSFVQLKLIFSFLLSGRVTSSALFSDEFVFVFVFVFVADFSFMSYLSPSLLRAL